jgi:hypothetical protein
LLKIKEIDFSESGVAIDFVDKPRHISLVGLTRPKNAATAQLDFDGRRVVLNQDVTYAFTMDGGLLQGNISDLLDEDDNNRIRGQIRLEEVGTDNAVLRAYCVTTSDGKRVVSSSGKRFNLREEAEEGTEICSSLVRLENV